MEADQEVLEKVIKDRGVDATGAELDSFIETLYATYANAMTQKLANGETDITVLRGVFVLQEKTDAEEARLANMQKNKDARENAEKAVEAKYGQDQTPEAKTKLFDTTQEGENLELFNKRNAEIKGSF